MNQLFQRNYTKIKNGYLIPILSESKISIEDYEHLKLRTALLDNIDNIIIHQNNDYILRVQKSIVDKCRISEIEKFYLRSIIQQNDFLILDSKGSSSWMITTQYYRFFFLSTCLQRILNRGFLWINETEATQMSEVFSTYLGQIVRLPSGNYRYLIQSIENDPLYYNILLSKQGSNMHQDTWAETKRIINLFIDESSNEERKFLEKIKKTYNSLQNFSPPSVRNQINYSPETSILEHKKLIQCSKLNFSKIEKSLEKLKGDSELNQKIKLTSILCEYFNEFIRNLLKDLNVRDKNNCILLNSYEKKHKIKILKD